MTPLLNAGIELMLIGMGTVFFFLTLLVGATTVMSRVLSRFAPPAPILQPVQDDSAEEVVAVISAAISQHRQRNR